ncbi:carbon-nitrogen hydrolase [Trichoderma austrokoningii]
MTIRVATASPHTQATTKLTLAHLEGIARRAADRGVDILLLPEAFIGGYPRNTTFGAVVGSRSAEGRESFAQYFDKAVDLGDTVGDGSAGAGQRWVRRQLPGYEEGGKGRGDGTREELERIARETGVFIVVGCIEKAGGSLWCSVPYICPREGMIGKRRKVKPTGTERIMWAEGHPSTLRAVSTTIRGQRVNLAAAICWENYMPLLRQSLYNQNINLYLAPTADGREGWLSAMRTIGIEGRCFVVSSNMCVPAEASAYMSRPSDAGLAAMAALGDRDVVPIDGGSRRGFGAVAGAEGARTGSPPSPSRTRHGRRKSVFDEDGNEIVLSCPAENGDATTATQEGQQQQQHLPSVQEQEDAEQTQQKTPAFLSRGGSVVVSPFGDIIAGPQWEDADNLLYADIDLRDCIRGRLDMDTAASYARNDAFRLTVDGLDFDPLPY